MGKSTVLVNGTIYDKSTGLPVKGNSSLAQSPSTSQKKQPSGEHLANQQKTINKPAPKPKHQLNKPHRLISDIGPAKRRPSNNTTPKIGNAPKKQNINSKLNGKASNPPLEKIFNETLAKSTKENHHKRQLSLKTIIFRLGIVLFVIGIGYVIYASLPYITLSVASARAGIKASYPAYTPDGYRLSGVDNSQKEISIKYTSSTGPKSFTLTQSQTDWDSTAVKKNIVDADWGDDSVSYTERGLTIYTYNGNAVWVNGGILYRTTGDAELTAAQIRSLAASL